MQVYSQLPHKHNEYNQPDPEPPKGTQSLLRTVPERPNKLSDKTMPGGWALAFIPINHRQYIHAELLPDIRAVAHLVIASVTW